LLFGVAVLLLTLGVAAQVPTTSELRGTWTATVGATRIVHGVWSARVTSSSRNTVTGSWALLNDARQIVLQGTWSAVKVAQRLNGTWSARVAQAGAMPQAGKPMSGTWALDANSVSAKTMDDLFQRAMEAAIGGAWSTGGLRGRWSATRTE